MKKIFFIFYLSINSLIMEGQISNYCDYYSNPVMVNASYIGVFEGDWQITSTRRDQWLQFNNRRINNVINYEKKFYLAGDKFAFGSMLQHSESGAVKLKENNLYVGIAYEKKIHNSHFRFGFQTEGGSKSLSIEDATNPSQFDYELGGFNKNMNNNEPNIEKSFYFINMNAGMGWTGSYKTWKPNFGIAVFNLPRPISTFYDLGDPLKRFFTLNIEVEKRWKSGIAIKPNLFYFFNKDNRCFSTGLIAVCFLKSSKIKNINLSCSIKNGKIINSMTNSFGIGLKRYSVKLCYENYFNNLSPYSGGAIQITFSYLALNTYISTFSKSCNRY